MAMQAVVAHDAASAVRRLPTAAAMRNHSKLRYAVVGQGYIAQIAVLPAFQHARRNSELVALVSGDPEKLQKLARRHRVPLTYTYGDYEECLHSGEIDAVYIALPNHLHAEYAIRAARAGVHVLCEKPMAVTERECVAMMQACDDAGVKLMIAYRLHFDPANLAAVEVANSGRLGELRLFDSVFCNEVTDEQNIRLRREAGGGPLFDIGIYCINAARYLFRADPIEVAALAGSRDDSRFDEVDEAFTVTLRFPGDRLATFSCSFGAAGHSSYRVVGTEGHLLLDPAYEYADEADLTVTIDERTRTRTFAKHDQFAPELLNFSDCVLDDREPEPSGLEGLADVRIIDAIARSARSGRVVEVEPVGKRRWPTREQEIRRPPVRERALVGARPPGDD
jgi:glucose-fructose oxidoreductase